MCIPENVLHIKKMLDIITTIAESTCPCEFVRLTSIRQDLFFESLSTERVAIGIPYTIIAREAGVDSHLNMVGGTVVVLCRVFLNPLW